MLKFESQHPKKSNEDFRCDVIVGRLIMKVMFVAGFSPIVSDMSASKRLYRDALGLPLEGDYPMTEKLEGVKHFGLWSLQDAARSCFGSEEWPSHLPAPQATIEFEVEDVDR